MLALQLGPLTGLSATKFHFSQSFSTTAAKHAKGADHCRKIVGMAEHRGHLQGRCGVDLGIGLSALSGAAGVLCVPLEVD